MLENQSSFLSEKYEGLIPPHSTLSNARTVYGEPVNEVIGEIIFRNNLRCIGIVGEAGSGKTIILKEVAKIVKKNRQDRQPELFYYDDIHEFVQHITNTKSSDWAKLRDTNEYPDLWTLSSTIALYFILEILENPSKIVIFEGVFCGLEDRLRSTTLKLLNLLGESAVGIIPVVPHSDTQQSAVMKRDFVSAATPETVVEGLRNIKTEPNPSFKNGDPTAGRIVKKYFEKSATGPEIVALSHESRKLAEARFLQNPNLEIYQEILNPKIPDISSLSQFSETTRMKALVFIDDFGKVGTEITPIINLPMQEVVNLYIPRTTERGKINTNFLKQLLNVIDEKKQSREWQDADIKKWFPRLKNIKKKSGI